MKKTQTQAKPQPKAETAEPSAPETTNSTKEVKKVITVKESEPVKTVKPKVTDNKISTKKAITKEAQKTLFLNQNKNLIRYHYNQNVLLNTNFSLYYSISEKPSNYH